VKPAKEEIVPDPEAAGAEKPKEAIAVTTAMIKELRLASGAGMMDCKKVLIEANGDFDVAIDNLRKSGLMKADKKASRVAAEGKIVMASSDDKAVLVEVNDDE
jgi:elongation factor Ts